MKKKIVIADDDALIIDLLTQFLCKTYDVTTVSSGAELLKVIEEISFSLVLTDLVMPDIDGLECISKIKAKHKDTPVICMSGAYDSKSDSTFLEIAKSMGAIDAISKPFTSQEILERIEKYI